MSDTNVPDLPEEGAAFQPRTGRLGRGGVHGRARHAGPAARAGQDRHGAGRRTDRHAGRRRRTGAGGAGLHGARQKRPCGPRRGSQRPLHRAGRHRAAAFVPLRAGIGAAGSGRNRGDADRGRDATQCGARHLPLRRGHPHDGRLHQRGDGRNPAGGHPVGRRAPFDAHPGLGARSGTSADAGGPGRRAHPLRVAHDIGPGADALSVAQNGPRTVVALAHGGRIRASDGDRGGNRRLRKLHRKISFGIWQNFGIRGSNPTR